MELFAQTETAWSLVCQERYFRGGFEEQFRSPLRRAMPLCRSDLGPAALRTLLRPSMLTQQILRQNLKLNVAGSSPDLGMLSKSIRLFLLAWVHSFPVDSNAFFLRTSFASLKKYWPALAKNGGGYLTRPRFVLCCHRHLVNYWFRHAAAATNPCSQLGRHRLPQSRDWLSSLACRVFLRRYKQRVGSEDHRRNDSCLGR